MNDLITDVLKLIIVNLEDPKDFCAFAKTNKRNYEISKFMVEKMQINFADKVIRPVIVDLLKKLCNTIGGNIDLIKVKSIFIELLSESSNPELNHIEKLIKQLQNRLPILLYSLYYMYQRYYKFKKMDMDCLYIFNPIKNHFIKNKIGTKISIYNYGQIIVSRSE